MLRLDYFRFDSMGFKCGVGRKAKIETDSLFHLFKGMNTDNTESQRLNNIISEIQALQEVVTRFRQLRLDATEFACLKCIVTFKAGELKRAVIKNYIKINYPH